jgi:hypothetical protein
VHHRLIDFELREHNGQMREETLADGKLGRTHIE